MTTPILSKEDLTYGERYFIPKEKQKMSEATENTPAVETVTINPDTEGRIIQPQEAPRCEARIAGKTVWVQPEAAMNFMVLEAVTRGMSKQDLAEFSGRYRLKIEALSGPTGEEKIVLCEMGVVDWGDGEHVVTTYSDAPTAAEGEA